MQTFKNVACKKLKLPIELVSKYRQWLVEVHGYSQEDMPLEGKEYAKAGLVCICSTGVRWREIVSDEFDQKIRHAKLRCDPCIDGDGHV